MFTALFLKIQTWKELNVYKLVNGQTNCNLLYNTLVQNTVTLNNLDKSEKYFLSEVKHKILYSF